MKRVTDIKEGVEIIKSLYEIKNDAKWEILPAGDDLVEKIKFNGKVYPFFWWRFDPQMNNLYSRGGSIDPVSYKLTCMCERSRGLDWLIYRETDIAEWSLRSTAERVMCFRKGKSANVIITMKNKDVAVLELGATLPEGTVDQGRHTIWGQNGMGSDRVVSQKPASAAIYMYTDNPKPDTFNDEVLHLYGMEKEDVTKVAAVVEILRGNVDLDSWTKADVRLKKHLEICKKSNEICDSIVVED